MFFPTKLSFFIGVRFIPYPFKFYTEVISINNQGRLKTFSFEDIAINFRTKNIFKVMQDALNVGFEWSGYYKDGKYFSLEINSFDIINAIGIINVKVSVKVEANDYYVKNEKELKKDIEEYVLNKDNRICSDVDHKITSIKF